MKKFLFIFVGVFIANFLSYSVSYIMTHPDPGFYLSYTDNLLIAFGISIIASLIFLLFYKVFHNSSRIIYIGLLSFSTQILTNITAFYIPDIGMFSLLLPFLGFALLVNVLLKYSKILQNKDGNIK